MSYSFNQLDKKNNHQLYEIKDEIKSRIKYYEKQINKLNETLSYTEHRIDETKDKLEDKIENNKNKNIIMKEFVEYFLSIVKKNANKPIEFFKPENFDNGLYIHPPYNQRCVLTFFKNWYSMMYPDNSKLKLHGKDIIKYLKVHNFMDEKNQLKINNL